MFELFQKWADDKVVTSVTRDVTMRGSRKAYKTLDVTAVTNVTRQLDESDKTDEMKPKSRALDQDATNTVVTPVTPVTEPTTSSGINNVADGEFVTTPPKEVVTPVTTSFDNLRRGVMRWGVAIAIDKQTGSALLMCAESDCQAVSAVADVYRPPFEIDLSDAQREEIEQDVAFMDAAQRRQQGGRREQQGEGGL